MADAKSDGERFSLKRWSRRKRDASRVQLAKAEADAPLTSAVGNAPLTNAPATAPPGLPNVVASNAVPPALDTSTQDAPAPGSDHSTLAAPAAETPLPPVDSLTFESDFRGFLQPNVDEAVKRAALKKLFSDPRFNVMDRLDVYIDDYSQPDPLPREWLREMASAQNILNPPQTRVNAQGFAEDVPPERVDAETTLTQPGEPETIEAPSLSTSAKDNAAPVAGVDTLDDVADGVDTVDVADGVGSGDVADADAASRTADVDTSVPGNPDASTRTGEMNPMMTADPLVPTRNPVASTIGAVDSPTGAGGGERFPMPRKPA